MARNSPRAKLDRADHHLEELQAEIVAFELQTKPLGEIVAETEHDGGEDWVVDVLRNVRSPAPDSPMGVIAGDAIHNARVALDHLVCALVERRNRTPTRRNAFPTYASKPDKARCSGCGKRGPDPFEGPLERVPAADRRRVIDMQPYTDPESTRAKNLLALHRLDVSDKHRTLTVVANRIEIGPIEAPTYRRFEGPPRLERLHDERSPVEEGTRLLRHEPFPDASPHLAVPLPSQGALLDVRYPYRLSVGVGSPKLDYWTLPEIRGMFGTVDEILRSFSF